MLVQTRLLVKKSVFSLAVLAAATAPTISVALPVGPVYTVTLPAGEFGSAAFTAVLIGNVAAAKDFCAEIAEDAYRVDCLAERFGAIANGIPDGTDYGDVQSVLNNTSKQLAELARTNRDTALPRGKATRPNGESTTRALTPIAKASAPQVNARAVAILDETETLLLRSAQGSESKAQQYARIADAVGSTKVLIRSA